MAWSHRPRRCRVSGIARKTVDVAGEGAIVSGVAGRYGTALFELALQANHKGEVTAEVTLADGPSDSQLAAIKEALAAVTKKDVKIDVRIDPAIIGGLIVKLGSRMVDNSLRTKLNAMKYAMKGIA